MRKYVLIALSIMLGGSLFSAPPAQAREYEGESVVQGSDIVERLYDRGADLQRSIICKAGMWDDSTEAPEVKRELGTAPFRDPAVMGWATEHKMCIDTAPGPTPNWLDPEIHHASIYMKNNDKNMKCEDGGIIVRSNRIYRAVATFRYIKANGRPYTVQPLPLRIKCDSDKFVMFKKRQMYGDFEYIFWGNNPPSVKIKIKAFMSRSISDWVGRWHLKFGGG